MDGMKVTRYYSAHCDYAIRVDAPDLKGLDFAFTKADLALSDDELIERIVSPAVKHLNKHIEKPLDVTDVCRAIREVANAG